MGAGNMQLLQIMFFAKIQHKQHFDSYHFTLCVHVSSCPTQCTLKFSCLPYVLAIDIQKVIITQCYRPSSRHKYTKGRPRESMNIRRNSKAVKLPEAYRMLLYRPISTYWLLEPWASNTSHLSSWRNRSCVTSSSHLLNICMVVLSLLLLLLSPFVNAQNALDPFTQLHHHHHHHHIL